MPAAKGSARTPLGPILITSSRVLTNMVGMIINCKFNKRFAFFCFDTGALLGGMVVRRVAGCSGVMIMVNLAKTELELGLH